MPNDVHHRDFILAEEINTLILRLIQLRDTHQQNIQSIKCDSIELGTLTNISTLDISRLSSAEKSQLCKSIGYSAAKRTCKCDIIINEKRYALRCMNYTDRALVNHSTRPKFEKVCKWLGISIEELDLAVANYIKRRRIGVFNEDCFYHSTLNPFISHKDYLRKLLTAMAFYSFNFNKEYNELEFVRDYVDYILDFINPLEPSTWNTYTQDDYFDSIWTSLCFSLRDTKGMPNDALLFKPGNESILKWNYPYVDDLGVTKNKAALHIRVKKYDSTKYGIPFESLFQEEIKQIKQNKGERDEYLLKLFLIECRQKAIPIPIDETVQVVRSVGSNTREYADLSYHMDWNKLDAEELISVCASVFATKAGRYEKADVFVNGIGISVKSVRGGNYSIINHTTRDKIFRVMQSINSPIDRIDAMVSKYWDLRLTNRIGEDIIVSDLQCPFSHPNEDYCMAYLKPLINYFAFQGTGIRDSDAPAQLVLSMADPMDVNTWIYYNRTNYVIAIWKRLVFSIRGKATPSRLNENTASHRLMRPWVRECNGVLKGALSVRVAGNNNVT